MFVGLLTVFAMLAFAANSLLCRAALGGGLIDPVTFTFLRLASGAALLLPLSVAASGRESIADTKASWASGLALFVYALAFSLAYGDLNTGTGALILFASVQATMIAAGLMSGERPLPLQWLGLVTALAGLVYLVSPGITAPDPLGASLMTVSGIAWGVYSIRGKGVSAPLLSTSGNFLRAVPMIGVVTGGAFTALHVEGSGILLALISGSFTSGLGYVLWYRALRGLSTTTAAIVQLSVPVLAAIGGIGFLGEQVTVRLVLASTMILGGIGLAVLKRGPTAGPHSCIDSNPTGHSRR